MLELVAMVCGLILCVYLPVEARKVRNGWVRKNFKGPPETFRATYLKQLALLMWVGVVIGAVDCVLAPLNQTRGEWIANLVSAAIWLSEAGIAFAVRARLAREPA